MADSFDYGRTCCLPRRPSQRATLARCHQMIREPLSTRPVSSIVSPTVTVHAAELSHSAAVWKCYVGAVSLTKWSPEERRYRTFPYWDYGAWAEVFGRLAQQFPHLSAIVVDDFTHVSNAQGTWVLPPAHGVADCRDHVRRMWHLRTAISHRCYCHRSSIHCTGCLLH
jgi:hypothetical protein